MKYIAWLLDRLGKPEACVPSPLTDEVHLDEGDCAIALVQSNRGPRDAKDSDVAQVTMDDGTILYGRFMDWDVGGGCCVRFFGDTRKHGVRDDQVVVLEVAEPEE